MIYVTTEGNALEVPAGTVVHAEPGSALYWRYGGPDGLRQPDERELAAIAQGHHGARNSTAGRQGHGRVVTGQRPVIRVTSWPDRVQR